MPDDRRLSPDEQKTLRAYIEARGLRASARALLVSPATVLKMCCGLRSTAANVFAVRAHLGQARDGGPTGRAA